MAMVKLAAIGGDPHARRGDSLAMVVVQESAPDGEAA